MSTKGASGVSSLFAPIAYDFSLYLDNASCNREYTVEEYLRVQPQLSNIVKRLSAATVALFDTNGYPLGNSVAITSQHLLTSGHCINGRCSAVVFDGAASGNGNLDFKILYFPDGRFTPAPLSVTSGIGNSIQMYSKFDMISQRFRQYVKPFASDFVHYATRSDLASVRTSHGESGAPRMSLISGGVHSIHQGESEGLKMIDIYSVLKAAARNTSDPQRQIAATILSQIKVQDVEMSSMFWSPLQLSIGAVDEEKPRIGGSVTISKQVDGKPLVMKFGYSEVGEGRGPRSIAIYVKGKPNSSVTYSISPNPHNNAAYNNDGQTKFYEILAQALANAYDEGFLQGGTVKALGQNYKLVIS